MRLAKTLAQHHSLNTATVLATVLIGYLTVAPQNSSGQDRSGRVAGFRPRIYAITQARLVRAAGREDERGTLVIRDGVIVDAGPDAKVPAGAVTIDGKGLVAYPGFIDADADDLLVDKPALPNPKGRTVDFKRYVLAATRPDNRKNLTPQFAAESALEHDAARLKATRQAGFTSVHIVPDGRVANGTAALVSTAGLPPRESIVIAPTLAAFALTIPQGTGYPQTLMGAHAHLRQALLDTQHFTRHKKLYTAENTTTNTASIPRPPNDDVLAALEFVLDGRHRAAFRVHSKDDIHRAIAFCNEHKIHPVLLGVDSADQCLDPLKKGRFDLLMSMQFGPKPETSEPPGIQDDPKSKAPNASQTEPLRVQRDKLKRWTDRIKAIGQLDQLGLKLAVGSRGLKNRAELIQHVRLAIQHGWPTDAALKSLTTEPARILGLDKTLGTLDPGRLGHVVLWSGPFQDPDSHVRYVLVDGLLFEYNKTPNPDDSTTPKPTPENTTDSPPAPPLPQSAKDSKSSPPKTSPTTTPHPSELHADRLKRSLTTHGNVLIRNATILTGTGHTLTNHSILVRNGKIRALGPKLTAEPGTAEIDASGRFVMPGIIDTHSHIKITGGVNESSQSIVPEVRIQDVINTEDVSEFRALAGGVTVARLLHGSANVIGGQDAVVKLKYGQTVADQLLDDAPQGVKFALGENVKFRTTRFPNTRMGVEATLNRAFLESIDYRRRWQQYRRASQSTQGQTLLPPRRDLRLEALADIVNHQKFIHSHCYRADEILMLLRVADNLGIRVWSLQHVLEGYKIAPEIAAHGASCSTFSDWWAYKVEAYDAIPHNAALLAEAHANVVIKSDDRELIRHLYLEAAKPIRYGNMPPETALATVTINAARELGLNNRMGSIEIDKDADLAIFNAHPLNSFARCEMTLVDGEVYFSRSTHPTAMSDSARQRTITPKTVTWPEPAKRRPADILPDSDSAGDGNPAAAYVLVGGTLHPVSGPDLTGTLVIQDQTITALGPDAARPADAHVIDITGLHVYPGLIDAGTNLGLAEIKKVRETLDFNEGGDLQPDLRAGVAINPDSELFPVARAGGITTALVQPGGGLVAGQASLVQLAGWTAPDMVLDYELGLRVRWPTDSDDSKRKKQIQELETLLEQAREYHALLGATQAAKRPGPIGDPRLDALAPYLDRKRPVLIEAHSRQAIVEAIEFAKNQKLTPIITGGTNAWKVAKQLKTRDIAVIVGPVMRAPIQSWDPSDAPYANPGRLYEAGVRFCIRSDNSANSRNAPFEAAMAVAFGLPEDEALKSVTLGAAQVLGIDKQVGSLEVGKRANLVILDGSPLQITSQVKGIFVAGRPFRPVSRQTRFYNRYRKRLKAKTPNPQGR